ncbi:hypothetical protein WR25_14671 [Diploscapter pachys]|uniref:Uncharacterized protein n=1 Tax=Diploscapter pachys TaxID=2018661 RepID=A0A2A2KAC7_9BILA|nr:hypothetical protein WR25_14671 [Diploscapter pachys]
MVFWLFDTQVVHQYLAERAEKQREQAQLEAEARDRADARAIELEKTRMECRAQTELARMSIEQERLKANIQIELSQPRPNSFLFPSWGGASLGPGGRGELEENKNRHEKYLAEETTRRLKDIENQARDLNTMQVRLQAEANETDRVAREDDERLDQNKYEERMERVKAIEQEHDQMMQQKEKQLEQIRAEANMDKKKAEEDYEQEKEWQEQLVKVMKKEHNEQRERMEKEINDAIARRDEHGDKMIENLREQERKMIQIHVEQRNALDDLMKKNAEDYRRRMDELNGKLAAIEKNHREIMNEIWDERKAIEASKKQLDAVQRQFIEEQRKTISEIADGFSQHNTDRIFKQTMDQSQEHSDRIRRRISDILNAHTALKMIEDSGNTKKINKEMGGIEAILQGADAIYSSIFTAQAKLIPNMITNDLIEQMIEYQNSLKENFKNLPRLHWDALEDIKALVNMEATKPTVSISHQMQYATIKDAQNAAIAQSTQNHPIAPADPHNPAPVQEQITYSASSTNHEFY